MGFFRILAIFLIISWVLRWLGNQARRVPPRQQGGDQAGGPRKKSDSGMIQDAFVPCVTCGTYNPKSQAFFKDNKYYCNQQCSQGK